ncbi:MAG TPA: hypothetical protein VFA65_24345 [Bryobacteraceae bacterium]|nr:hypothetical protein [Bryobacteraceae bacterium]
MTTATLWLFYILAPQVGLIPVPNSPAFTDQAECVRALEKADPFLPGKTACWPAPWKLEDRAFHTAPEAPKGEHVD